MPIAVKANLEYCNFQCHYCFLQPENRVKEYNKENYNLNAILKTMDDLHKKYPKQEIIVHGGEPTCYSRKDFEVMLKKAYELTNKSAIQTNGWRIDEYFDLFKKYKTSLGISFDGLREANLLRGFGSKEQRLEQAVKVEENIFKAIEEKIPISLIAIITRQNGIEYINKLKHLLLRLKEKGVTGGRLNPCTITENIAVKPDYELSIKELIEVYDDLFDFCLKHGLGYSPFRDIATSLRGDSNVVCVFKGCDYYATPSLIAILGDGSVGNCVKTYRGGPQYLRDSEIRVDIRKQLLKETDCKGCKWFEFCNGGCPNDGIGGDWRRKTKFCPLYNHLFHKINDIQESMGIRRKCISCLKKGNVAEHFDGTTHHIDSDLLKNHSDSVKKEHLDIGHRDYPDEKHSDGIEHIDGDVRHEDG